MEFSPFPGDFIELHLKDLGSFGSGAFYVFLDGASLTLIHDWTHVYRFVQRITQSERENERILQRKF